MLMEDVDGSRRGNIDNDTNSNKSEFYPFYVIKKRASVQRRRSSLQSWQHRHKIRLVRRLVRKSGKSSIHQKTTPERSFRFFLDLSNTLIENSWFSTLFIVTFAYIITWLIFAGFWAIISIENVDVSNGTSDSCLEGINSFAGYLLFSIETQSTIGYGGRYINEYCVEAIIGLCIQLIIGVGVCGSLICIVFLKMESPKKNRDSTVSFSKKAVICQRDGELCLIFRVRDYDMRYECHTKIDAYLVEERRRELSLRILKLQPAGILIWPVEVVHKIDETSPFWDLSAKDLLSNRFEIIVVMEGSSLATSYMSRTTTSYLNREIKWGRKFTQCIQWDKAKRKYVVDHKLFNKTEEAVIPLCSAQRLHEVYNDVLSEVFSSYPSSIPSDTSKYSSPTIMSPLLPVRVSKNDEDTSSDEDRETASSLAVVTAQIHHNNPIKSESSSSATSDNEDYTTFMDLSIEDITAPTKPKQDDVEIRIKKNLETRPRTISSTAKDFFNSIQKFVSEASENKKRSSRKYEETSF